MSDTVGLRLGTTQGRGVLFATVLGSGIAVLDSLVVNVALPTMDRDLELGVAGLQWTVSGYLLTVSTFLLLGGSLGDLYGRRRIYIYGLLVFIVTSVLCGLAPNATVLVAARVLQGVGGALMIPASLAIIQAVFVPEHRGAAIGAWTGLMALFTSVGPFVGGVFVTYVSWRWAFFINFPFGLLAVWASLRWVPENRAADAGRRPDVIGSVLAALGLAGVTYWGIEGANASSGETPMILGVIGLILLAAFVFVESRVEYPMMPLSVFHSSQFNWVNLCTVIFYGAFVTGVTFVAVQLQTNLGYSPLEAAIATLPVSIMLFFLSKHFGAWGQRVGAKYPMSIGPTLVAVALLIMSGIQDGRSYWTYVLPAVLLWGLGLSMTVAPLTAAAMAAVDQRHVGVGSAINNAASRVGQTLAISLLPAMAGIAGVRNLAGTEFADGFRSILYFSSGLCLLSALLALVFVTGRAPKPSDTASVAG